MISNFENTELSHWLMASGLFFLLFTAFMALQRILWKRLEVWTANTTAEWDDLLVKKVKSPLKILLTIAALGISIQVAPDILRLHVLAIYGPKIGFILCGAWIVERLAYVFFFSDGIPSDITIGTRALFMTIFRFAFFPLVLLIVLDTVGISITPLLASLGVGSVAVALALQDTLGNFFSGIYILADKPFAVGDFINVDGGQEGTVMNVGWRSTQIKLATDNVVVIPNSKIAASIVTNYDLPARPSVITVPVGVSYDCDLAKVEVVTLEVAKSVLSYAKGGNTNFTPAVRFKEFGDSSINLIVALGVQHVTETALVRHEFIKALHERFKKENISIPYPHRTIQMIKE